MATKKYTGPRYAYTQGAGKTADDKFDVEALEKGEAGLFESKAPDQKAMRYIKDDSLSGFLGSGVGGGRSGGKGGATAKELKKYEDKLDAGVYTSEKGKPPSPREMAKGGRTDTAQDKAMIKKAFKQHDAQKHKGGSGTSLKLAHGGVTRADGCITKGHTKGRMV
jgi:hypothetical protein